MSVSPKFQKIATTVIRNAPRYKSKVACQLMLAKVKRAWERAGCYGCNRHLLDDARWACQLRFQELLGIELDAKFAAGN